MNKTKENYIHRLSRNEKAFFTTFSQLREYFHLKPLTKQTSNKEKLEAQRNQFLGKCKVCHSPLEYISQTNILKCSDSKCKGIEKKEKSGLHRTEIVVRILNRKGAEIADTLFQEP